ncbi:MAG: endonuclease III [Candidatus Dormibacteraeota bacterium]|nr:endonuclease III [Candidatus Dormibacteraeota bacterium]
MALSRRSAGGGRPRQKGKKPKGRLKRGTPAEIRARTLEVARRLALAYPDARTALVHDGPFQLIVATILSAQTTDQNVNAITPALFARYPDARALADANPADVERIIMPTGFFRNKTGSIIGCARALVERFGGEVPPRMEDLVTLPGVGRKTANVVLGVAWQIPGLAVDTHVTRLAWRLGLTKHTDPVKIEAELCKNLPPEEWTNFGLRMILHGRQVCTAKKPNCPGCVLNDICPSAPLFGLVPPAAAAAPMARD